MFSRGPNFLKEAQESGKPDLVIEGVEIPEPTPEDLKWKKKADKYLSKCKAGNRNKLNKIFEKANKADQHWRLWYVLNIRHKLEKPDNLFSDLTRLVGYDDAHKWTLLNEALFNGDEISSKMMAATFDATLETKFVSDKSSVKRNWSKLPVETLLNWHTLGNGYCPEQTLVAILERGTNDDLQKLISIEGIKVFNKIDFTKVLKHAVMLGKTDMIEVMLKDSNLEDVSLKELIRASEDHSNEDAAELFKGKLKELLEAMSLKEAADYAAKLKTVENTEQHPLWQKVSDTYIIHNMSTEHGELSAHFDFSARRMTQMQKVADDSVLILFSENFSDIEGQFAIEDAAEVLLQHGGTPDFFEGGPSARPVLKTVKKSK